MEVKLKMFEEIRQQYCTIINYVTANCNIYSYTKFCLSVEFSSELLSQGAGAETVCGNFIFTQ